MNKNGTGIVGLGLIAIGILGLLINFNVIDLHFWDFWPFIILVVGLSLEVSYFTSAKKDTGVLVPAGILITISGIFIANVFTDWNAMEYLWPLFIMAPGVGLLQMYLFSKKKDHGVLVPIGVSLLLGGYFLIGNFFSYVDFRLFISIAIILIGLFLIFNKGKANKIEE
ncbi:MAG: hypothetical protein H7X94_13170 [Vallitaleaceae bacterium]|nr:hypothetical protein [Vallitaleaceae bacterium]